MPLPRRTLLPTAVVRHSFAYRIGLILTILTACRAGYLAAATVSEDFESWPVQSDTRGLLVQENDGNETWYLVTPDGQLPESANPALIVSVVTEHLARSAGIASEGENQYWVLGANTGQSIDGLCGPGGAGFILNGAIGYAGTFGLFSTPQNLQGGSISLAARATTSNTATGFRFLLVDDTDKEKWTDLYTLTTSFQTFNAADTDFTIFEGENDVGFDITRISFVGVDFCTVSGGPQGSIPQMEFHVDDVSLTTGEGSADNNAATTVILLLQDDEEE